MYKEGFKILHNYRNISIVSCLEETKKIYCWQQEGVTGRSHARVTSLKYFYYFQATLSKQQNCTILLQEPIATSWE